MSADLPITCPTVSVVMPVYDAEPFLEDAVRSVLDQTFADLELVAVDDGSTDGSSRTLARLADEDERIVIVRQPNGGEAAARNTGVAHASGRFIAWQDADDVSLPRRIETLLDAVTTSGADFAHSDMTLIDAEGVPLGYWRAAAVDPGQVLRFFLAVGTAFNNPTMLTRREVFDGLMFDTELPFGCDTDMVVRALDGRRGVHVESPLLLYRRHGHNISNGIGEDRLAPHVIKLLGAVSLERLVPEIACFPDAESATAVGEAIVGLALLRRGLDGLGLTWLDRGARRAVDGDAGRLVGALVHLAAGDLQAAADLLVVCADDNAVAHNYLGEVLAFAGRPREALAAFQRALHLAPDYGDPLDNIAALGAARGVSFVDRRLHRFTG